MIVLAASVIPSASAFSLSQVFQPVIDVFSFFLIVLPGGSDAITYFKLILWIGFYVLFLALMPKLPFFKDKDGSINKTSTKLAKILALVISLIVILNIPNSVLVSIFDLYSFLAALILFFGLPAFVFILTRGGKEHKTNDFIRGAGFIVMSVFLMAFDPVLTSGYNQGWAQTIMYWTDMASASFMVIGIIYMIKPLFSGEIPNINFSLGGNKKKEPESVHETEHHNAPDQGAVEEHTQPHAAEDHNKKKLISPQNLDEAATEIEAILKEINNFHTDIADKRSLMQKEVDDYGKEIMVLEELLTRVKDHALNIKDNCKVVNGEVSNTNLITNLQQDLNSTLGLNSQNNITTQIRAVQRLDDHISEIDKHIVTLQQHQTQLIQKSKDRLWKVDNLLEGEFTEQNLVDYLRRIREAVKKAESDVVALKKFEKVMAREEGKEINEHRKDLISGHNTDAFVNSIIKNCNNLISKKHKNINTLNNNLKALVRFLETSSASYPTGEKIKIKKQIYDTIMKILEKLPDEASVDDMVINELQQILNALHQVIQMVSRS